MVNNMSGDENNSENSEEEGFKKNTNIVGCLDSYDHGFVYGWAFNQEEPESSVIVNVMLDNVYIGRGVLISVIRLPSVSIRYLPPHIAEYESLVC